MRVAQLTHVRFSVEHGLIPLCSILPRIEYAWHSLLWKTNEPSVDMGPESRSRFPISARGFPDSWPTR